MEKNLKDYAHYYIGFDVITIDDNEKAKLIGVWDDNAHLVHEGTWFYGTCGIEGVKLILRRLEDMTVEEAISIVGLVIHSSEFKDPETHVNEYGDIMVTWGEPDPFFGNHETINVTGEKCWSHDQFHFLLQQGFDIFGLIDSGLALDAATLPK